jgi:hypothetical protein
MYARLFHKDIEDSGWHGRKTKLTDMEVLVSRAKDALE